MTYPRWQTTRFAHDNDPALVGVFCQRCNRPYSIHEPTVEARCPFVPMFDDPAWGQNDTD